MSCGAAIVKKTLTLKPDQTIAEAVAAMKKAGVVFAPVLDDVGNLAGTISIAGILENAMPVSLAVGAGEGVRNVALPSAPGMGKRIRKYEQSRVGEIMSRAANALHPGMPLEAAIRRICASGLPVPVVDGDSGAYLGIVTEYSALEALEKMG